jgi:predicted metal-binding protein
LQEEQAVVKDSSIQVKDLCRVRNKQSPTTLSLDSLEEIDLLTKEFGFYESETIETSAIVTARWVGLKCRYGCANYNTSWCCPPAAPDYESVRELLSEYELALLLLSEGANRHFYRNSSEKRRVQIKQWKATVALERKLFLLGYYKAFGLPAETCALCKECAYPRQCKFPNEKRPSLEACSIDVFETLKRLGRTPSLARRVEDTFHSYSLILLI